MTEADPRAQAEELFEEFLARRELEGTRPEFEALCREHPRHEAVLRELHADWCEVEGMLSKVRGRFAQDEEEDAEDSAVHLRLRRLEGRGPSSRRYVVQDEIARGGMGIVLRAWDDDVQRDVAMKVLRRSDRGTSGAERSRVLSRFFAEAQITGQLEHPGVVSIHDIGLDEKGGLYFTMTLVKGRNFSQILEQVRRGAEGWTTTRALNVLLKVCEALAYAHAQGVIHRDLKPSNVMVGRFGEVYVMDWGLAKVRGREDFSASTRHRPIRTVRGDDSSGASGDPATLDGMVLGTPSYMPPEQALGQIRDLGPRSDVYSVGAMLYELLAARPPYSDRARTPASILECLQREAPTPVAELARPARELRAVCEKAMARDREQRYASIEEMAEDLRAFLEGRVVQAYEQGATAKLRKWFLRNRRPASAVLAASAVALLSLGVLWVRDRGARRELETKHELLQLAHASEQEAHVEAEDKALSLQRVLDRVATMFELPRPSVAQGRPVSLIQMLDQVSDGIEDEFRDDPLAMAHLSFTLGRLYQELGHPEPADHLLRLSQRAQEQLGFSDRRLDILTRTWELKLATQQDRLDDARAALAALDRIVQQRSDPQERALAAAHRGVLEYRSREFEAARRSCAEAIRWSEQAEDAAVMAYALCALSRTCEELGEREQSEAALLQAQDLLRERLGEESPRLLAVQWNLASVWISRGRYEEGIGLLRRVASERERILGPRHGDTLDARNDLALALRRRGDLAEALAMMEHTWEQARETEQPYRDPALESRRALGGTYVALARYEEARPLVEADIRDLRRRYGPEHPKLVPALCSLALVEWNSAQYQRARELQEEALAVERALGPEASPAVLVNILLNLSNFLTRPEFRPRRLAVAEEAYELAVTELGETDELSIRALGEWAWAEFRSEQGDCESHFDEALELAADFLDPPHPVRCRLRYQAARCFLARGHTEDAQELLEELVADCSELHPDLPAYRALLAEASRSRGLR